MTCLPSLTPDDECETGQNQVILIDHKSSFDLDEPDNDEGEDDDESA
jgi:hypothetical protein